MAGPLVMGAALSASERSPRAARWPVAVTSALLFCGGPATPAASPARERLTTLVRHDQAADLSGLVLTASLLGQVLGVAAITGVYFGALVGRVGARRSPTQRSRSPAGSSPRQPAPRG